MPSGIYKHKKGYKRPPISDKWRKNLSISHKGKNIGELNPAKREEVRLKISQAMIGNKNSLGRIMTENNKSILKLALTGEKNYQWKGENVSYRELHKWLRKHKGIPTKCSHCGKTKGRIEWANISGKYRRDFCDFISLCKSCHNKYDGKVVKNCRTTCVRAG